MKYIENSFSNYKDSYLTLASIFYMDYPIIENDTPYLDRNNFFPGMLWPKAKKNKLLNNLNDSNFSFFWAGNSSAFCKTRSKFINCLSSDPTRKYTNILLKFYLNTPVYKIFYKFNLLPVNSYYPSDDLLKDINKNKYNLNNFFFIHNLSPHAPYLFNEDCSKNNEYNPQLKNSAIENGYKKNYICSLKKIKNILNSINQIDSDAIIVIQADHGWNEDLGIEFNEHEKIIYRAKIFNAIKAPEKCFQDFGLPLTNINTIRFIMNCALGYDLKKVDDKHFINYNENSINYGTILDKTNLLN